MQHEQQQHKQHKRETSSAHLDPPPSRRGRKGITVHWPFQSIVTDTLSIFTAPGPELFRRATWQPPKQHDDLDTDVTSPRDSTLIPDYVVNFIRGETPESVARRKRNNGNKGLRAVDVTHQHHPQPSHMALFEGDGSQGHHMHNPHHHRENRPRAFDEISRSTASSAGTELQRMLRGNGTRQQDWWRRLSTGWRSGILLNLLLVFIILVLGFICLVVAGTEIALLIGDMTLFTGSCSQATRINWISHAVINVVVVILIVGANYVFQVLSSPTRSEVTDAHQYKQWLEIGIPSVRNFKFISRGRSISALVVLAVAVMTQIIYNSIIFTTETVMDYNLVAVQSSFLTGAEFSNVSSSNGAYLTREELQTLEGRAVANELTNLTLAQCLDVFTAAFNADYQTLVLVVAGDNQNALVATARAGVGASAIDSGLASIDSQNQILVDGAQVKYCLGQPITDGDDQVVCSVQLNGILLASLLGLNLITFFTTASALLRRRFEPLVTLGDALTSFLRDPDPATRMNGLLTKKNILASMGAWGFSEGKYWVPTRDHRWFRSASLASWIVFGVWWLLPFCLAAGILALTLITQASGVLSGFGVASAHATYFLSSSSSTSSPAISTPMMAIITATPQLLLAGLYFATNTLLTSYFLTHESSRYATLVKGAARRALRVSTDPEGHQTSSLYLTLPRPISWALAVWFAAMGFVLSQACFIVSVSAAATTDDDNSGSRYLRGLGFSGTAMLILLGMLVILFLAVVGLGFRRVTPAVMATGQAVGNPLVFEGGSCSAVISARCHRIPNEMDVWTNYICWGVVPEMGDAPVSHVTYSARPLIELDGHHRYV